MLNPLGSLQAKTSAWLRSTSYTRKWLFLGALVGIIAGLGAVVFFEALKLSEYLFLQVIAGYKVPTPVGEGGRPPSPGYVRPWAIPLVAVLGALLGGILVSLVAPDAEGHGTDAAIDAVHHNPRGIRMRTVVVKIVASALTIGSGGSGGREGPTGQISAGFGSFLSRIFDLSPGDARITVASGIGAGIGSIFGAPLGGSVLATEIMYRDDFEVEALLPSFIASIVGYSIWGSIEGFGPLFGYVGTYQLKDVQELGWFAVIGILGGLIGLLYAKGFYGIARGFSRIPLPRWVRPALGGLLVGLIALAIPEVIGTGYGWIQQSLGPELLHIPFWIVLVLPFVRIVATGFSIGSGGSGGIFGPGMVIGAFIGAAVWRVLEPIAPSMGHDPAPFVVVGMMACFGSISRAPLAIILMVAEMTGSFSLIVPAMVAVGLATLIVRRSDDTIYRSQLKNRNEAPAHRILTGLPLLGTVRVSQAMAAPRCVLSPEMSAMVAAKSMEEHHVDGAPLVDLDGAFLGVVPLSLVRRELEHGSDLELTGLIDHSLAPLGSDEFMSAALDTLTSTPQLWSPVIDDGRHVIGTIAISDIARSYRGAILANLRRANAEAGPNGAADVLVSARSSLIGAALKSRVVPRGVLVTSIERAGQILQPEGDSVIKEGDHLLVLGGEQDIEDLERLACSHSG